MQLHILYYAFTYYMASAHRGRNLLCGLIDILPRWARADMRPFIVAVYLV